MAKLRKYRRAGKKTAIVRGIFIEHVRRDKLLAQWDGLCGICGYKVNPQRFEIDHWHPASKGGEHSYANCRPAHPKCNRLKADKMPEELAFILPLKNRVKTKEPYTNDLEYRKNLNLSAKKPASAPAPTWKHPG